MSNFAVMPISDYENTCNAIREKTGSTEPIKSGDMAAKIPEVYNKGKADENKEFWDTFQDNGARTKYAYAFYEWKGETISPIYDILCYGGANYIYRAFYNSNVKRIEKPIRISGNSAQGQPFTNASSLETITLLDLTGFNNALTDWFSNCNALKNITIEGEIPQSINFKDSQLTPESMVSVITHLKNYNGTSNAFAYEVKFTDSCWNLLNTSTDIEKPTGYSTWQEYVQDAFGWNV